MLNNMYISWYLHTAKPYWLDGGEPQDIETSVGAKATFICRAGGDPRPRIEWYINGVKFKGIFLIHVNKNSSFLLLYYVRRHNLQMGFIAVLNGLTFKQCFFLFFFLFKNILLLSRTITFGF